jgi:hypothetical protein
MNIAERQTFQDYKDVEQQLQQEIHLTRSGEPGVETKSRPCGICGKTEHNARTCYITIEASNGGNSDSCHQL